ncbi:MAG: MalY/PatB family protein [Lachnospiraceae bacterium]
MKERVIYKERKNTNCEKWDGLLDEYGRKDLLPVWVADMDFEAPSCVQVALQKYIDFNVYGYYHVSDSFYDSIISWEKKLSRVSSKKRMDSFYSWCSSGNLLVDTNVDSKEESVLIMPPVYYPFFNSIKETGRQLVECPLLKEDEHYKMDIELFENKILTENVKVFILCSPHNPVGRVWTKKELQAVLDICKKYGVYVIADEIHQDIIMSGYEKVTAATCGNYDEYLITLTSASKSFNIAGFQCAYAIIPNAKMREDYDRLAKKLHFTEGNSFSYIATQAVYEHGRPWLESVCNIVESNYYYLKNELKKVMPKVKIAPLEGTYLAWLDMSDYEIPKRMKEAILDKCHLAVDFGELFGGEEYKSHIRLNLATSRENIEEVVKRLQLIK